jgi:hypothetical protein
MVADPAARPIEPTPTCWDRGPSARRGHSTRSTPPRPRRSGAGSPDPRTAGHPGPQPPTYAPGGAFPGAQPPPPNGQPQPPTNNRAARSLSPGKRQPTSGSSHNRPYSGASRAGAALAHSATPPPPSTPKSPSPDPGAILSGDTGGEDTPRRRHSRLREHPCSLRGPSRIGRDARPDTAPFVPRACRSRPHTNNYTEG